ncbi:MAG: branched-chain amino acid ABC transporter permease [Pseudomonadota bacterium]
MDLFINQVFSGLVRASLYFLVTSGLTLLFGVVGTLNMAHFSLYMIASYLTWTFHEILAGYAFSYWAAFVCAGLAMAVLGLVIERVLMRHLYDRELGEQLLITFAMVYILDDLTKLVWGSNPLFVTRPEILSNILSFGNINLPAADIFVLLLGLTSGTATWYLLSRTGTGRILRAAYSHKEMLPALGIPIHRTYMGIFVFSCVLAGVAGSAWTVVGMVDLGQAHSLLIESFCVMVIGGMGSFAGTALSAVICGLTYSFGILYVPKLATLLIFVLTGLILVVRPWGLLGQAGRLH